MKKCSICGLIKSKTFNCCRCGRRVCLSCFNITDSLCFVCVNIEFNEKYVKKIEKYEQGVNQLKI